MELKEKYESKYTATMGKHATVGTWKDRENPPQNPMFGYNGKTHASLLTSVAEEIACALRPPVQSITPHIISCTTQ